MSFTDALDDARNQRAVKSKRELQNYLRREGLPTDLGSLQAAMHLFPDLTGGEFSQVLEVAKAAVGTRCV